MWGARGVTEFPPADVYHHLLRACPAAVVHRNKLGELPLHVACQREEAPHTPLAPFLDYFDLLLQGPRGQRGLTVKDSRGRLPLHLLMSRSDEEPYLAEQARSISALTDTTANYGMGLRMPGIPSLRQAIRQSEPSGEKHSYEEEWLKAGDAVRANRPDLLGLDAGAVLTPTATVTMALLDRILALAPQGAAASDAREQLPLHIALRKRQPIQIIRKLLDANCAATKHPDEDGDLPLHIVLKQRPFRRDAFAMLLDCDASAAGVEDGEGNHALHIAVVAGAPIEAVRAIYNAHPLAAGTQSKKTGALPLHLCVGSPALPEIYLREVVEFLLKVHPEGASMQDKWEGMLPLHYAVQSRAPRTVVLRLFTAYQDGCRVLDAHQRYPYQYCDFAKVEKLQEIAGAVAVNAAGSEAEALKAFKKIDQDGSGDLDLVEIEQLTKYFGKPLGPKELDKAFEEMDTDHSGTVDFAEFMAWWRKQNMTGRSREEAAAAAAAGGGGGVAHAREEVDDGWHEEIFALLSVEVLGERLLLCGRPPREMVPLYERAAHIYTSCYIELFGTYQRPEKLFARLTTVKALAQVHERLADLMFPVDPSNRQSQSPTAELHKNARHGKRATGDEGEYAVLRQMRSQSVGLGAIDKLRRQVYRRRDILDFRIEDGVVEKNLVGIVENCDRAFELTEQGFVQPIPQHKLKKIQRDALVALSNWVEPAATEYDNRMKHMRSHISDVQNTEGGRRSYGAKQWDPDMQKEVTALVTEAEQFAAQSDPTKAEYFFLKAQERQGELEAVYDWDPEVVTRLGKGLAEASKLANAQRKVEKEAAAAAAALKEKQEESLRAQQNPISESEAMAVAAAIGGGSVSSPTPAATDDATAAAGAGAPPSGEPAAASAAAEAEAEAAAAAAEVAVPEPTAEPTPELAPDAEHGDDEVASALQAESSFASSVDDGGGGGGGVDTEASVASSVSDSAAFGLVSKEPGFTSSVVTEDSSTSLGVAFATSA